MSQPDSGAREWKAGDVLRSLHSNTCLVIFTGNGTREVHFAGEQIGFQKTVSRYWRRENFQLCCQTCHAATGGNRWCAEHEPREVCKCPRPVRMFGRVCAACGDALPEDAPSPARQPEPPDMRDTVVLLHKPKVIFSASIPLQKSPDLEAMARELTNTLRLHSFYVEGDHAWKYILKALQQVDAAARETSDSIAELFATEQRLTAKLIQERDKARAEVENLSADIVDLQQERENLLRLNDNQRIQIEELQRENQLLKQPYV